MVPEQDHPPKGPQGPQREYMESILNSDELTAEQKVQILKDWE
jgi:hypothetical protein